MKNGEAKSWTTDSLKPRIQRLKRNAILGFVRPHLAAASVVYVLFHPVTPFSLHCSVAQYSWHAQRHLTTRRLTPRVFLGVVRTHAGPVDLPSSNHAMYQAERNKTVSA